MKQLILERVKVIGIGITIAVALSIFTSSCATVKADCRGVKHQRLANGIYL